jgi:predicted nuclease of predicted toxin-antitoxin system
VKGNRQSLTVLLDEGTPVLSANPFLSRGYQVIHHAEVLESGASDEIVAAMAILNNAALIAVDLDMKRLVRRFGSPSNGPKFKKLDLIFIGCDAVMAEKRLEHAMSFVENEWSVRCEKAARRMWVNIDSHRLTTYR